MGSQGVRCGQQAGGRAGHLVGVETGDRRTVDEHPSGRRANVGLVSHDLPASISDPCAQTAPSVGTLSANRLRGSSVSAAVRNGRL